ncbi:MAG: four helix bundle protein [Thermomicrobiales bacterium]|nr:four helix bundle protein [Thermomicrobiales bacterium]
MIRDFKDLRVWQGAMALCERLYRITWTFPRSETYGLAGQIQRAAVSIPSNIAEGHTRESIREYLNFLSMARSSLAEIRTQVDLARRLGYIDMSTQSDLESEAIRLAKQLTALRNALRRGA